MTIVEKYLSDLEYNFCNPLFAPIDDIVLGKRFTGRFQMESGDDTFGIFVQTTFDNGHRYLYSLDNRTLYEGEPLPSYLFMHKYIEKTIYDAIVQHTNNTKPLIYCTDNEIISDDNPFVVIRVLVNHNERIVRITNILIKIRHKGHGKQLIRDIYLACNKIGYKLWLTEITTDFYYKLVKRGAKIIEEGDVVEITGDTELRQFC
ncbi:MAG: hypothetical protein K5890_06700 [Bacteroidales bacterium]|nr:hypothetical protein [Bacteroidales bacterium]